MEKFLKFVAILLASAVDVIGIVLIFKFLNYWWNYSFSQWQFLLAFVGLILIVGSIFMWDWGTKESKPKSRNIS